MATNGEANAAFQAVLAHDLEQREEEWHELDLMLAELRREVISSEAAALPLVEQVVDLLGRFASNEPVPLVLLIKTLVPGLQRLEPHDVDVMQTTIEALARQNVLIWPVPHTESLHIPAHTREWAQYRSDRVRRDDLQPGLPSDAVIHARLLETAVLVLDVAVENAIPWLRDHTLVQARFLLDAHGGNMDETVVRQLCNAIVRAQAAAL
jgi:hypothetical protein